MTTKNDNVVPFDGVTSMDIDPIRALEGAANNNLQSVVVIGWDDEGRLSITMSHPDKAQVLYLIESAKALLFQPTAIDSTEGLE